MHGSTAFKKSLYFSSYMELCLFDCQPVMNSYSRCVFCYISTFLSTEVYLFLVLVARRTAIGDVSVVVLGLFTLREQQVDCILDTCVTLDLFSDLSLCRRWAG